MGKAVQVDPIKPTLRAPGAKRLKLKYDETLSNFAFNFNLRRYNWDAMRVAVDAGEVPSPPPLSYSWFHSNASGRIPGWLRYLFHFHRAIPRHDPSHQGHGQGLPIIIFSASI